MSGVSIEYTIEEKAKIVPTEGKMQDIMQKRSNGFRIQDAEKFQFSIKLKTKAIINLVQYKPMVGQTIFIEALGQRKTIQQSVSQKIKQGSSSIIEFKECRMRKQITTRLRIELTNKSSRLLGVGLFYLLVKGQKIPEQKPKPKGQFFEEPKYSVHKKPISVRNKEIFDQRKKKKIEEEIIDLDRSYQEDRQLRKALQLSKTEKKLEQTRQRRNQHRQQNTMTQYVQPRQYTKVDFDKHKHIFQHVNPTWLEAQRAQQVKRGIKEADRLSNVIQVKHFHNKKIYIDVPDSLKRGLAAKCESMGAKILKQPVDFCIFITNRVDTEKVAKAKKLKHIKILKPNFIEDCKRTGAYLDEKEYYHKL